MFIRCRTCSCAVNRKQIAADGIEIFPSFASCIFAMASTVGVAKMYANRDASKVVTCCCRVPYVVKGLTFMDYHSGSRSRSKSERVDAGNEIKRTCHFFSYLNRFVLEESSIKFMDISLLMSWSYSRIHSFLFCESFCSTRVGYTNERGVVILIYKSRLRLNCSRYTI